MVGAEFHGLIWVTKGLSLEPAWTLEPDLEAAPKIVESLGLRRGQIKLSFLAQGAFNRLYDIPMPEDTAPLILTCRPAIQDT